MKFIYYYIVIIALCVIAAAAARFLIPAPETVALMYMDSHLYEEAEQRYVQMLKSGGSTSGNVIIPLARLYARRGEDKRALGLVIRYMARKNDLTNIQEVVNQLSHHDLKPRAFWALLVKGTELSPSCDLITRMGWLHEKVVQDTAQIRMLKELTKTSAGLDAESDFDKLIYYFSQNMKWAPDTTLVTQLSERIRPKDKDATIRLALTVFLQQENYDQALALARKYITEKDKLDPFVFEQVVAIFLDAGQARLANELFQQFISKKEGRTSLQLLKYRLAWALGQTRELRQRIQQDFRSGRPEQRTFEFAFRLALSMNDTEWCARLLEKEPAGALSDSLAFDLAFDSMKRQNYNIAEQLRLKLNPDMLRQMPTLNYMVTAGLRRMSPTVAAYRIGAANMDNYDRMQLGYVMWHYGYEAEAMDLVSAYPAGDLLAFFTMRELIDLVIRAGDPGEFLARCEHEAAALKDNPNAQAPVHELILMLAAASGRSDKVNALLERGVNATALLVDAYDEALHYGHGGVAVELAQRLRRQNTTDAVAYYLAMALAADGKYRDAIDVLRKTKGRIRNAENLLLQVATKIIERDGIAQLTEEDQRDAAEIAMSIQLKHDATPTELKQLAAWCWAQERAADAERYYLAALHKGEISLADINELVKRCRNSPGEEVRKWFVVQAGAERWPRWQCLDWLNRLGLPGDAEKTVARVYRGVEPDYLPEYLTALLAQDKMRRCDDTLQQIKLSALLQADVRSRIAMIGILKRLDRPQFVAPLLTSLSVKNLLDHLTPADTASLYLQGGRGAAMINELQEYVGTQKNIFRVWLYLQAAVGNETVVNDWLTGPGKRTMDTLIDLYYFASDNHRPKLARKIAVQLFAMGDNPTSRLRLAEALVADNDFSAALALVCDIAEKNNAAARIYLAAISGLVSAKKFSRGGAEDMRMQRICDRLLKAPGTPEPLLKEVVYALINAEHYSQAKPAAFQLALRQPNMKNPFIQLYLLATVMAPERQDFRQVSQLTDKIDRRDEAALLAMLESYDMQGHYMMLVRSHYGNQIPNTLYPQYLTALFKCRQNNAFEQMVKKLPPPSSFDEKGRLMIFTVLAMAGRGNEATTYYESLQNTKAKLPLSLVRRTGLYFVERRQYEKAIPIFLALARDSASPTSSELGMLINLPGVETHRPTIDWLVQEARAAHGETQLKWLEILNHIKQPQETIKILRGYYAEKM